MGATAIVSFKLRPLVLDQYKGGPLAKRRHRQLYPPMVSMRPKLLIAETEGFSPVVLNHLCTWAQVDMGPVAGTLAKALSDYDIVWTRLGHQLRAADLPTTCRCRILAIPATGLDHIDVEACGLLGIRVVSLKGETDFLREVRATAEHTLALALALLHRVPSAHTSVLAGRWDRNSFRGRELYGRTVGIVGMGRLGSIVAGYYRAFGTTVIGYDPRADFPTALANRCDSLEQLCERSQIISVHVAYHHETRKLLNARHLDRVSSDTVLVNTSRGGILDEVALLQSLMSGRLAGAALDVLDGEPKIGPDNPLVHYASKHDNLLLTPHIGGNTEESVAKTERFIADKVHQMWLSA